MVSVPKELIEAINAKVFGADIPQYGTIMTAWQEGEVIALEHLIPILEAHFAETVTGGGHPVPNEFTSLLGELKKVGYITLQEEKEGQSE